jgi:hypothetical protein
MSLHHLISPGIDSFQPPVKERNGKCRGSQHLAGAVVLPSEEDSQTFTVNFATGEIFKVAEG